jgi:hypothetical protein
LLQSEQRQVTYLNLRPRLRSVDADVAEQGDFSAYRWTLCFLFAACLAVWLGSMLLEDALPLIGRNDTFNALPYLFDTLRVRWAFLVASAQTGHGIDD